eukprot:EG_transcript_7986
MSGRLANGTAPSPADVNGGGTGICREEFEALEDATAKAAFLQEELTRLAEEYALATQQRPAVSPGAATPGTEDEESPTEPAAPPPALRRLSVPFPVGAESPVCASPHSPGGLARHLRANQPGTPLGAGRADQIGLASALRLPVAPTSPNSSFAVSTTSEASGPTRRRSNSGDSSCFPTPRSVTFFLGDPDKSPASPNRPMRVLTRLTALALHTHTQLERLARRYRELEAENERLRAALSLAHANNHDPQAPDSGRGRPTGSPRTATAADPEPPLRAGGPKEGVEPPHSVATSAVEECAQLQAMLDSVRAQHKAEATAWQQEKAALLHQLAVYQGGALPRPPPSPTAPNGRHRRPSPPPAQRSGSKSMVALAAGRLEHQETLLRGLAEIDQIRGWRVLLQRHAVEQQRAQRRTAAAAKVNDALAATLPWSPTAPADPHPTLGSARLSAPHIPALRLSALRPPQTPRAATSRKSPKGSPQSRSPGLRTPPASARLP